MCVFLHGGSLGDLLGLHPSSDPVRIFTSGILLQMIYDLALLQCQCQSQVIENTGLAKKS
jgi:hypothetical protein